jgi:hypothetical protein
MEQYANFRSAMFGGVADIQFSVIHRGVKSFCRKASVLLTKYPRHIQVAILKEELHTLVDGLVKEFEDAPQNTMEAVEQQATAALRSPEEPAHGKATS